MDDDVELFVRFRFVFVEVVIDDVSYFAFFVIDVLIVFIEWLCVFGY